jgi:hypothetical protein
MRRRGWKPEWDEELNAILDDCLKLKGVPARREELLRRLTIAATTANGKQWVPIVYRNFAEGGADRLIRTYDSHKNRIAFVDSDGRLLSQPARGGVRRAGDPEPYQRELFYAMTWDELRSRQRGWLANAAALNDGANMIGRLLELEEQAPGSATPAAAAETLGIDLEAWLLRKSS